MKTTDIFAKKVIFAGFAGIVLSLIWCTAQANAVVVEPSRREVTLPAGKVGHVSFSLINKTTDIMTITTSVKKYFPLATETAIPPDNDSPHAIKSAELWIQPELTFLTVNPGEVKEAVFTVTVPEQARGEYAAYVSFDQSATVEELKRDEMLDNETSDAITEMNLDVVLRRSVPVYIFIEGTTEIQAELVDMHINNMLTHDMMEESFAMANNRIKFAGILKNTGSQHIRAKGSVVIFTSDGELMQTVPIGITWPILPGYTETIPVFWESPKKAGQYTAIMTIELGNDAIVQREMQFTMDEKGFLVK